MIAIKGMEMPEDCAYCSLRAHITNDAATQEVDMCLLYPTMKMAEPMSKRQSWCPLVEIGNVHENPEDGYKE